MKNKRLIAFTFALWVIAGMMYVRGVAHAQAPAAVTVTSYDYYDCDPQVAGGASCEPKIKYVETRLASGERVSHITELQVPGQPTQYHVDGHGKFIRAFPEINAHFSFTKAGIGIINGVPNAQNGCLPSGATVTGSGELLGHRVTTYSDALTGGQTFTSVALDLNCYPLRTEIHWKDAVSKTTVTNYKVATEAVTGVPPDSIWEAPIGSVETLPSELYKKLWIERFKKAGLSEADAQAKWQTKAASTKQNTSVWDKQWLVQHSAN